MDINDTARSIGFTETSFIERLSVIVSKRKGTDDSGLVIGIGDDAAYARVQGGVLFTTDALVDGVHFRSGEIPWFDLGWKAITASQSDVSAMGGAPTFVVITLGLPAGINYRYIEEVYRGMEAALGIFGGECIGGDIVRSPVLFINAAMMGKAHYLGGYDNADGVVLRRDMARIGDEVAVTGPLGGSAGGLESLRRGLGLSNDHPLIAAHFRPRPKVKEAKVLVEAEVCCAMDISDGLATDLEKLAIASDVGAILYTDKVPLYEMTESLFPGEGLDLALSGGEDYELLFTAQPPIMERALDMLPDGACRVGNITKHPSNQADPRVRVVDSQGRAFHLAKTGWDHFA